MANRSIRSNEVRAAVIVVMRIIVLFLCLLFASAAVRGEDTIKPITSVEEGLRLVREFKGKPQDFKLAIPDSLMDPVGLNIALITNEVLKRHWMPADVKQMQGYRLFTYKEFDVK